MSRLSRYQSTLKKWGLIENPFRPTPPDDPEKLAKISGLKILPPPLRKSQIQDSGF